MDSKDVVTEKSLVFLQSVFDSMKQTPQHAYPVSLLPYPKNVMKQAVKEYIFALGAEKYDGSLASTIKLCEAKSLYLLLADFMDGPDTQAAEKEREEMNKEVNVVVPAFNCINLLSMV